ncbi:MAG TPA: D-alanine--D-alanine ligase [Fimbriimonadaceae bacterium]|nr:D-alanine--D-alanine ligase [Fimbriimonadaceae bacterium]HRJ33200.1 D-alanine--D-alanine ligase [Fimbriimonadaceae bacterium]
MRTKIEIAEEFAPREALNEARSFFLVGIGGAGMSGLARMLRSRGFEVRGTDSTASDVTRELERLGVQVQIGHTGAWIRPGDALILSDAIDLNLSPEVQAAREKGVPLFRRSQLLGWLLKGLKLVAVTGTHGKTTTTAMLGSALKAAGLDPLIVVGAEVPDFGSAVVEGKGPVAVVEACEAYDSFHDLDPDLVVLTNLEPDHLDFHGDWDQLRESVVRFASRIRPGGALVYSERDFGAREVAERVSVSLVPYSADQVQRADLRTPGAHNRENAAGAWAAAQALGADPERALEGIAQFSGAQRRLQVLREGEVTVIDDYAHHPTEIRASLQALRERYPERRIVVVFQPHLYSRTRDFLSEFAPALSEADFIVLTDIYPAREDPLPGISSARILEQITRPARYVPCRFLLPRMVRSWVRPGDVVVGMGAGNIDAFAPEFLNELDRGGATRVVVLGGGDSAEREVSKHSARAIAGALRRRGYEVWERDMSELLLGSGHLTEFVGPERPDLAFLAVHGTHAEDGAIQGLLELLHLPYTGSGIQASALAMDKALTKQILASHSIRVPHGIALAPGEFLDVDRVLFPCVVKPNAQGSTVGLRFVDFPQDLEAAVAYARQFGETLLIEEKIEGMEISVPIHRGQALPPVEIVPKTGQYDFASKYLPGATEEIVPARLPEGVLQESQRIARAAHHALGCRGATRVDMIVRGTELVVLEVNTLPGMTATSLLPNSAQSAGIDFDELCHQMAQEALSARVEA